MLVPTAVLSGTSGQAFSVQQVERVFAAQGLVLRRQALPVLSAPFEMFDHHSFAQGFELQVTVYRPGTAPPALGRYVAFGALPRFARRGNVLVSLAGQAADSRTWRAAERALARLRYSPADAARPQLPTIVLRRGERRTLTEREAPLGTEVMCSAGKTPVVSYGIHPAVMGAATVILSSTRSTGATTDVTIGTGAAPAKGAQLSWRPLRHGTVLTFTCSAAISAGQVVVNEPGGGSYGLAPPSATVSGPLPPLKLPRPDFTLRNEYANVPAKTLHAMLGPG